MRDGHSRRLGDRLRVTLGPGKFTKRGRCGLFNAAFWKAEPVGTEAIRAAMREPVVNLTDVVFAHRYAEEWVNRSAFDSLCPPPIWMAPRRHQARKILLDWQAVGHQDPQEQHCQNY